MRVEKLRVYKYKKVVVIA